jgi:hypothetical protein
MKTAENDKCTYEAGPCPAMKRHADLSSESNRRSGIFALDNRLDLKASEFRMYHGGFALKGSPSVPGNQLVMLNFCPWCGADVMAWHNAYRADCLGLDAVGELADPGTS